MIEERISKLYKQIWEKGNEMEYDVIKQEKVPFNKLAHFVSMEGTEYRDKENEVKLLVIGRAVNGWYTSKSNTATDYEKEIKDIFVHKGFDWVIEENGILYNKDDKTGQKGEYCLSSPFWDTTKTIYEYLIGKKAEGKWVEKIAWTNLYKIAPTYTGNPEGKMLDIQNENCIEILKAEIEYYKPTHILALTGWKGWMEKFEEIFTDKQPLIRENILRGKNKNNVYLEAVRMIGQIPVAIACRPEWRPKNDYINDVKKAFKL